jgi:hypothetical protein
VLAEGLGLPTKLVRRVVTRWNSDLDAIRSHTYLMHHVQRFTAQDSDHKLNAFRLTHAQWDLARHLEDLLAVSLEVAQSVRRTLANFVQLFEPLTLKFSQGAKPLMADVLEDLEQLHAGLLTARNTHKVYDDDGTEIDNPPIIRAAAHAATLVYNKYLPKLHESKAYSIAIGMLCSSSAASVSAS